MFGRYRYNPDRTLDSCTKSNENQDVLKGLQGRLFKAFFSVFEIFFVQVKLFWLLYRLIGRMKQRR